MMDFFKKIYLAVFPCEKEKETILSEKAEFKKKAEMFELRTTELRKELEEGQKNATLSAKEIVEKNLQLEKLMNELEASQADIGVLAEKLEDAVRPTSSLCGKKIPALMREVINPKRDNVYLSGFRIRYKNQNRAYDFRQYCAPVQVGGVCFDYVLDPEFFRPKMSAKEVFDKSLEIVQTKFGYETDSSLYQMLDSWAPPILTQTFFFGDCDDLSTFVVSLFDTYQLVFGAFPDNVAGIGVGFLVRGSSRECHAFPVLMRIDSDEWTDSFIGEATLPIARRSDTIEKLKENYTLEYGLITLPLEGAMNGGMVVMEGNRYWEKSGTDAGKDITPNPKGKKKEKKKILKDIWKDA